MHLKSLEASTHLLQLKKYVHITDTINKRVVCSKHRKIFFHYLKRIFLHSANLYFSSSYIVHIHIAAY